MKNGMTNAVGNRADVNFGGQMATFQVGDVVVNFGQRARVLAVDPDRGLLVRALPGQGFGRGRDSWHADPAKCLPFHPAEVDPWMVNPEDRDFVADPSKRWCRVCAGPLDDPRHGI